jgi:hypothetical protein
MRSKIKLAILLGALILSPGLSIAADEGHPPGHDGHSLEQLVIETADSPADHAALAKHYRAKAAEARAEAARHEKMASTYYLWNKRTGVDQMGRHCKKIAANSMSSAAEYDALAELHDAESKKAK